MVILLFIKSSEINRETLAKYFNTKIKWLYMCKHINKHGEMNK